MRRLNMIILFVILALVFVGCSKANNPKEKAEEFLNIYYGQYEMKDEIKEIANQSNLGSTNSGEDLLIVCSEGQAQAIMEFIDENFKDMLTDNAKELLVSNRLIPKLDVLDSDIVKATVTSVEFDEDKEDKENLSFNVSIEYEYEDGSTSTSSAKGWIKIVEEEGKLKVDGFRFY